MKLKQNKMIYDSAVIFLIIGLVIGVFEVKNTISNYHNNKINETAINWRNQAFKASVKDIVANSSTEKAIIQYNNPLKPVLLSKTVQTANNHQRVANHLFSYTTGKDYDLEINSTLTKHNYTNSYNVNYWKLNLINNKTYKEFEYAKFAKQAIKESPLSIMAIIKPDWVNNSKINDFNIINGFNSFLDYHNIKSNTGSISTSIVSPTLGLKINCEINCPIELATPSNVYDKNFWKLTSIQTYNT